MHAALPYVISIVAFVIVLNFVMLFFRLRRDRVKKPSRLSLDEERAALLRHNEIKRRIEREEKQALEHVELRNKTLELYDEVRRRAAAREKEAAALEKDAAAAAEAPVAAPEPVDPPVIIDPAGPLDPPEPVNPPEPLDPAGPLDPPEPLDPQEES